MKHDAAERARSVIIAGVYRPGPRDDAAEISTAVMPDPSPPSAPAQPTCRNCGALSPGAYCPACGQETRLRLQTLREFMREAAGRYVAFDGKWWKSLAALMVRPGFLTREYFAGRRRRYVRPARLFLIASLLLFAVLRIATDLSDVELIDVAPSGNSKATEEPKGTPVARDGPASSRESGATEERKGPTVAAVVDDTFNVSIGEFEEKLPVLKNRIERFNRMSSADKSAQLVNGMLRYGPYAAFALLPAYALLLKLLYLGRRRRYPARPRLYGEHLVFAAHNHAFLFFVAVAAIVIPVGPLRTLLLIWAAAYMLWSLRAVYGGSWTGIAVRSLAMLVAYLVLFALVTLGLLVVAILLR